MDVAQLVEPRVVIPVVVGSSPIVHPNFDYRGPLAQLVEQETLNLLVVGSIPTRPTNFHVRSSSGAVRPHRLYCRRPDARPKVLICVQVCPERQRPKAKVAELVDALDLGSSGETRESSSLSFRTSLLRSIGN